MKASSNTINILLAVCLLFMFSCASEELEGPTGVKLTLKARTMLKSASDTVKINEASIGVSSIDFKPEVNETKSVAEKIVYNGPYVIDLLNGNTTPEIKWVFVDPGVYREVKISTSDGLQGGHSIIVKGTIKPAGINREVPFEFSTKTEQNIVVKNNQGIVVKQGHITELMIVFEMAGLFNEFDLSSVERNSQGVLMLTDETGSGIVAGLKERLETISSFGLYDSNFSDTQVETAGPGNSGEPGDSTGSGGGSGHNNDNDGNAPGSNPGQDVENPDPGAGNGNDNDGSSDGDPDPGQGNSGGNDNKDDDWNDDKDEDPASGGGTDEDDDGSGDNSDPDDNNSDDGSENDSSHDDDKDEDGSQNDDGKDDDDNDRDDDRDDDGRKDDDDDDDDDDDKSDEDNNEGKDDDDERSGNGNSGNAPGNSGNAPGNSGNAPGNSGNAPGNSGNGNKGGNSGKGK